MAKKKDKFIRLNDYVTYRIIDNTLYLIKQGGKIDTRDFKFLCKKIELLIEDNDIAYINISSDNMDEEMDMYKKFGFVLSKFDINKLNSIYSGINNKGLYRIYGIITKSDFLNSLSNYDEVMSSDKEEVISSNSGFVLDLALLFGGIGLLCFFCIEGAIYLVKQKG